MTTDVTRTDPPAAGVPVVPVENEIVELLVDRDMGIAVAESFTVGAIASRLCSCPGTEDRVAGGVVSYTTSAKRGVLGVAADRVVSAPACLEMARSVRELFAVAVGLGVTGVAGPERQDDQPVGTVFVGWATPGGEDWVRLSCAGTPEQIRAEATEQALRLVLAELRGAGAHAG
jgi:nicotinamide-nucleotide amidase